MRTVEEIKKYYENNGMFEFREDVLEFLSFEDSKEFYNKDYVEKN